jgi:hypothetical protein
MDLILDTSNVRFQASGSFEARTDKDGNHRRDKSRDGTGAPLHAVKLVAWLDNDAETILVTVATENPPKVTPGQSVTVESLQAMPWVQNGAPRIAYRAKSVVPVNGSKPAPQG